ncbi:MAG: type II toxin-antitoxin system prevent-host-death family antitoxin [Pseudomonadales bacterium]
MSTEIGAYDAKTKLPEILRRVERGESFTITNRGRPVADLIPTRVAEAEKARLAISSIRENAGRYIVRDADLSRLKELGRA